MKRIWFVLSLTVLLVACASQGQKSAEIEQRDLFDQQKDERAATEASRAKEQEELKRRLEEQKRRQQDEQAIVRPLPDTGFSGSQIKGEGSAKLDEPGSALATRSIYYEFNKFDIKEEYVPVIEAHANYLQDRPELKIVVQGNCDDRGSREYNLALGQRRADGVKRAMVLLGVSQDQMDTVSFGAEKPVAFGQDEESWAKNRRADLVYPNQPQ